MAFGLKSAVFTICLMGFAWTACGSSDIDMTASQPGGGSETSVAVGFDGSNNAIGIVANNAGNSLTPGHVMEWSGTTDGSEHSEAASPWVTGDQAPNLSDGSPYMGGRSDPSIIWTGWANQFAYVSLAESVASFNGSDGPAWPTNNPIDVVVAVSNDGGQTFGPASGPANGCTSPACFAVISTPQSSGMDTSGGFVDQAVIVAEQPTTHVAWVTWDNVNVPFNGGGKRPWIRRLHFNQDGTIDFGPVTEVRIDCNLSCAKFDSQNLGAYCDPEHAVNDNCTGGTETELVAFPRVNNSPFAGDTALIDNQHQVTCSGTIDVQWRVSISQDGGTTWKQGVGNSDGSTMLFEDPVWPNCIVLGATANNGNNRGRMAVVHDDNTLNWHVYWTAETFNGANHTASGQRVFHGVLQDSFVNPADEELDPVFTLPGASGPCGTGTVHGECLIDQFMPSASWSPGVHAAFWHDTRLDPATPKGAIWGSASHSNGEIGTFTEMEVDQAGAPWPFTGTNGNTPWGDYEGMASDRSGDFVPAWGDNRLQDSESTNTHVWARVWVP